MENYEPLSPKELERGYFILTHRQAIKQILLVLIGLVIIIVYAISVFNVMKLIQSSGWQSLAISIDQSPNWSAGHSDRQPLDLINTATQFIPLGDRLYDLVAFVENPNPNWAISNFQYRFVINDEPLAVEESFLNPGESKMIIKTGYQSPKAINSLKLEMGNLKWRYFDNDTPVINWDINEVKFQPISRQTVDDQSFTIPPRVTWQAKNLSLYNFWEVDWQVAIFSGDKLIGVKEYQAENWVGLESRDLEVVWLNDLPRVTKTIVSPELNWLDFDNYQDLETDRSGGSRIEL